jgi:hypothetical protein
MDLILLDKIPFHATEPELMQLLRIRPGTRHASDFSSVFTQARALARPMAAFGVAESKSLGEDTVEIDGVRFQSRVLRVNIDKVGVVFPYIATCGTELERWSESMTGTLQKFWADALMLTALGCAVNALESHLKERLGNMAVSAMNPGSLEDWPISEQAALFTLLGDAPGKIGARLTDTMVIRPLKSVSGIFFISEEGFSNCALCPREHCPLRRAAYDPGLYEKRYASR